MCRGKMRRRIGKRMRFLDRGAKAQENTHHTYKKLRIRKQNRRRGITATGEGESFSLGVDSLDERRRNE